MVFVLAYAALLSACATRPTPVAEVQPIPADRVVAFEAADAGADSARLTFIRDKGMINSGCYAGLYINGTLAGRVGTSETATFTVPSGEVQIRVARDPQGRGLCATLKDHWTQRETVLKPGQHKTMRIAYSSEGVADVMPMD